MIKFLQLDPRATIPERKTEGAAGFDICAVHGGIVCVGAVTTFNTGIAMQIPDGYVGLIKPRSGLAAKYGVDTMAGVIDMDFRGEVRVMLTSHQRGATLEVNPGDRIAQLVVVPFMGQSEVVDSLDDTKRGIAGFGSTGL